MFNVQELKPITLGTLEQALLLSFGAHMAVLLVLADITGRSKSSFRTKSRWERPIPPAA